MQYELVNRYYGLKMISPSEEHKNAFLASCKKDPKDNLPVWAVHKELPDREESKVLRIAALTAELAELDESEGVTGNTAETVVLDEISELQELKREYLLKSGKEAHVNATVKSLTKKLEEYNG